MNIKTAWQCSAKFAKTFLAAWLFVIAYAVVVLVPCSAFVFTLCWLADVYGLSTGIVFLLFVASIVVAAVMAEEEIGGSS